MSTICIPTNQYYHIPLFNPYVDRGISEDAFTLVGRISGISNDFLSSIRLGQPMAEVLQSLNNVFKECSTDNWDGYGAKAIDRISFVQALRFIHSLPRTIPTPDLTAEPDGEIALEWYHGKRRIFSVSIGRTGELTYAGLFGSNKTHGTEYFGDELPKTILDNIQRTFS